MTPYFKIIRPLNVLIASLSVIIGYALTHAEQIAVELIWGIFSVAMVMAAANIVNDIYDAKIDKINRPNRPIPAGQIKPLQAWKAYWLLNSLALISSAFISLLHLTIAAVTIFLLWLYSFRLKGAILTGNLMVSFVSALTFVYATLIENDLQSGIFPALFAFLFHFGREVIKDMQDMEGDLKQGARTFAGVYGKTKSIILINLTFIFLIVLLFVPYWLSIYTLLYLKITLIGVVPILVWSGIFIWYKQAADQLGRISSLLKWDMLVGLFAIYVGS